MKNFWSSNILLRVKSKPLSVRRNLYSIDLRMNLCPEYKKNIHNQSEKDGQSNVLKNARNLEHTSEKKTSKWSIRI